MKLSALNLRQRDGVTCGPSVAVVAGALLDKAEAADPSNAAWFADEQARVHAEVNRVWPRRLGTTPTGMARALTAHSSSSGVRYRWRLFRGRRDKLADVRRAVEGDWPVAMLIGRLHPTALGVDRRSRLAAVAVLRTLVGGGALGRRGCGPAVAAERLGLPAAVRVRATECVDSVGDELNVRFAG